MIERSEQWAENLHRNYVEEKLDRIEKWLVVIAGLCGLGIALAIWVLKPWR